jgi:hypothetical protein
LKKAGNWRIAATLSFSRTEGIQVQIVLDEPATTGNP